MNTEEPSALDSKPQHATGVLAFEADKYLEYVEEFEMTEAQRTEFLRTLWDIMATFVRLGFGVDSVLPSLFQKASENATDALEQEIPTHEFNVAADEGTEEEKEA